MRFVLAVASLPLLISAAPEAERPSARSNAGATNDRVCAEISPRHARSNVRIFNGPEVDATFDLHHAVVRKVDGCIVPAIVRRDVDARGGDAPRTRGGEPAQERRSFVRPL